MARLGDIRLQLKPDMAKIAEYFIAMAEEYERLAVEYREGAAGLLERWPPPDLARYEPAKEDS